MLASHASITSYPVKSAKCFVAQPNHLNTPPLPANFVNAEQRQIKNSSTANSRAGRPLSPSGSLEQQASLFRGTYLHVVPSGLQKSNRASMNAQQDQPYAHKYDVRHQTLYLNDARIAAVCVYIYLQSRSWLQTACYLGLAKMNKLLIDPVLYRNFSM